MGFLGLGLLTIMKLSPNWIPPAQCSRTQAYPPGKSPPLDPALAGLTLRWWRFLEFNYDTTSSQRQPTVWAANCTHWDHIF